MLWFYLLTLAIALVVIGTKLKQTEQVHSIALNCTGLISVTWGFTLAPPSVQLLLGLLLFGLVQFYSLRV